MYRQVSITQLPPKLKVLTLMHQDPSILRIYECKEKDDLYDLGLQFPFETTVIANNANATKTVNGYFIVGLAIPGKTDPFRNPVIAYYYMNDADYRLLGKDVVKEVNRRKKLWNETKSGWRRLQA